MKINEAIHAYQNELRSYQPKPTQAEDGFAGLLSNSLDQVNELMQHADQKAEGLVTGESANMHDAMIAFEKAETALKLLVQVRNKAIEAYKQVSQMQV